MNLTDPIHKKILGILFIVFSALGLLGIFFYDMFMDVIFDIAAHNGEPMPPEASWIFDLIDSFLWAIAILFFIPKIIIGVGLINQRRWANTPSLVYGIISLVNIPIGTAIGVYSILIYTAKDKPSEETYQVRS